MNILEWYWLMTVVIIIIYGALILWFTKGWNSIPLYTASKNILQSKVSVIIPYCNEEKALEKCINSLLNQTIQTKYIEFILVNDNSKDNSPQIAEKFAKEYQRIIALNSPDKGKKQALLYAIEKAKGELIITSDADCIAPKNWVKTLTNYFEDHKPNMIIGPVKMSPIKTLFQHFQYLEFTSLIGTGAGAAGINHAIMCNGANLAFSKEAFVSLDDPYKLDYASGDDVFLLHAMKILDNEKIDFIKSDDAIVKTKASKNLKKFYKQRKRWASKTKGYTDNDTLFTAFIVLSISLIIVFGLVLIPFNILFIKPFLIAILAKTAIDTYFFYNINSFLNTKKYLPFIGIFELLYALYVALTALNSVSKTQWKH